MEFKTTKTTMKQVAESAGVSTATVARVIHKNGYVSDEARDKVLEAIRATGYQLNTIAQSLRQQKTYTIAHILESTAPNPFYVHVSLGARAMAQHHNYHVLDYNVQHDPISEKKAVETFISRRVDAILFTTALNPENVQLAIEAGIPVVQVEKPRIERVDTVIVDNYTGAQKAVQHLIDLGHRHIAYIGFDPSKEPSLAGYTDRERFAAYSDTLLANGIPVEEKLIGFGEIYSAVDTVSVGNGREIAHHLLTLAEPPTAIFLSSDNAAAGAMQAIYELGLKVPDDVSVIGFDDTYASYLSPPLTAVKMPMIELGETAVKIALERINMDSSIKKEPIIVKLKTDLIVRESTGVVRE